GTEPGDGAGSAGRSDATARSGATHCRQDGWEPVVRRGADYLPPGEWRPGAGASRLPPDAPPGGPGHPSHCPGRAARTYRPITRGSEIYTPGGVRDRTGVQPPPAGPRGAAGDRVGANIAATGGPRVSVSNHAGAAAGVFVQARADPGNRVS